MFDSDMRQPGFREEPDAVKFQRALGREPRFKIGDTIAYIMGGTERDILKILAFGYRSFGNNPSAPAVLLENIRTRVHHSMVYRDDTEAKYEKVELLLPSE